VFSQLEEFSPEKGLRTGTRGLVSDPIGRELSQLADASEVSTRTSHASALVGISTLRNPRNAKAPEFGLHRTSVGVEAIAAGLTDVAHATQSANTRDLAPENGSRVNNCSHYAGAYVHPLSFETKAPGRASHTRSMFCAGMRLPRVGVEVRGGC
jgi:hypothetical protein